MRVLLLAGLTAVFLAVTPGAAQNPDEMAYEIKKDEIAVSQSFYERNGQQGLYVRLEFTIRRLSDHQPATDVGKDEILVEEDGKEVALLEVQRPREEKLTTVLALDISGSMKSNNKIQEAKKAAGVFLDRLDARADVGLILFDHEMRVMEPPSGIPAEFAAHRDKVRELIRKAEPMGGTAYLQAVHEALLMLKSVRGRRAVVVMTDGVDLNSRKTLADVIALAKVIEVPVYTLGIGEPGKNEPVSSVLVLDRSGSMREPANDTDKETKMEALHVAASRFVELMRSSARSTLLPFSSTLGDVGPFSQDKREMIRRIEALRPEGGTLLYDATYAGIETVVAGRTPGKKAVVVLTDGRDEAPGSRMSDQDVIDRAKEAHVPLYMLGLGREKEVNEPVMRRMAAETGGKYFHAGSTKRLFEIFEKLSIDLHDDGIDEASLRKLARDTGGEYYPVRDVSKLKDLYEKLANKLETTYTVVYRSPRSKHDGTARGINISVMRGGKRVSNVGEVDTHVRGVVVPEMDYRIYLILLGVIVGLLAVPAGLRHLSRAAPGG